MRFFYAVIVACVLVSATQAAQPRRDQFEATEKVRLLLESTGMSNKEAYLLLGEAIHEHVSATCPDHWRED